MKMLCIDGGGIRGVFAISILQAIEEELGQPIGSLFDVIAGTSTGSIIAASAALDKNMTNVLKSYQAYGEKIFIRKATVGFFKSVYSDQYLRGLLKKAFGETTLEGVRKPLLIPAVDITNGKPYVHRSNFKEHPGDDLKIPLWDAILSSCSAPVYFPPNNVNNQYLSIDGGLWANNPSLVCITEGLNFFHKSINQIEILSIGTGKQHIDFKIEKNKNWGIRKWLPFHFPSLKVTPKLIDLAVDLSSESVSYYCEGLLKENYLRINADLLEEVPFDEVAFMEKLIALGRQVFQEKREEIKSFISRQN